MDAKRQIFKDPEGKFSIAIPAQWKYEEKKETDKKTLHQFQVSPRCVFQISFNQVNDHIAQVVAHHKILPHDFSLPNISYVEKYHNKPDREVYNWMALIDDQFIFALYFYDPKVKDLKNLGLELMDVRMILRHIIIHKKEDTVERPVKCEFEKTVSVDYADVQYWRNPAKKFFEFMSRSEKFKTERASPLKVDPLKLYALLRTKISHQPNGFFDLMKAGKPLDNPIWWDFILECDKGFIQVWRTPFIIEASYYFDGPFDLETFFNKNIQQYKKEIETTISNFDRHTIYINHYQSYRECVETLWKEISAIDLTLPKSPLAHMTNVGEMESYTQQVKSFSANSVKYHALAKSLVLNAAFKVESFLNLIIRIGSTPELRLYPDVLAKFTKQDFQSRVKNIRFYSQILTADIDMESNVYRETKQLMTLRNKYVHYEEDAVHNKLGEIYYDRDYPLHPVEERRPAIEALIQTFHHPDMDTVRKAYETSNDFITMVESLFEPTLKGNLCFLIEQNPIGYNESIGIYSSVYTPISLDFFTS